MLLYNTRRLRFHIDARERRKVVLNGLQNEERPEPASVSVQPRRRCSRNNYYFRCLPSLLAPPVREPGQVPVYPSPVAWRMARTGCWYIPVCSVPDTRTRFIQAAVRKTYAQAHTKKKTHTHTHMHVLTSSASRFAWPMLLGRTTTHALTHRPHDTTHSLDRRRDPLCAE